MVRNIRTVQAAQIPLAPQAPASPGNWSAYPAAVARRVAHNFPGQLTGLDIALAGDLPPAAGLSSSSALIVGLFLLLSRSNHLDQRAEYQASITTAEDLAGYLGCVENGQSFHGLAGERGVGTFGGSQDHAAILLGRAGCFSRIKFAPVHV